MKAIKNYLHTALKVSLVLILLGFFGKKSKAEVPSAQDYTQTETQN